MLLVNRFGLAGKVIMRCAQCGFFNSPPLRYCGNCGAQLAAETAGSALREGAERRHLTVMFCDLVGSTALSEQLDPEEFREIILAYRETVAEEVNRYGGYIAQYVGDGILAYFGYPRARGDDAVAAAHASLAIRAAVARLSPTFKAAHGADLMVHIGIHTGLAIAGELARGITREESAVVGETPNLAARLEKLAGPNVILVSSITHALIKHHFACRALGGLQIAGLSRPISTFEIVAARETETEVWLSGDGELTPLAGRKNELAFLDDRWRQVLRGMGQAVFITGEPGIGKSRLARAFADRLGGSDHLRIAFRCSPHFSNTAFFPVIEYLNRWLAVGDSEDDKLARLHHAVAAVDLSPEEVVPILAALLSLPVSAAYKPPDLSAKVQRERTMEFLIEWLLRQASERPTLLIVEDLHWADASSLDLVLLLLDQIHAARIFLLMTFRPEFRAPWSVHSHLTQLALGRLTMEQVQAMIHDITGGKAIPDIVRNQLIQRTDGVPLFVEESTKAVVESGLLVETAEGYELSASPLSLDIPVSLHDTLMARLDSLNSAKLVAQRAAVIGREFSYALLHAITSFSTDELDHALVQLVQAELLFQRGLPPRSTYIFKHSMIQEAAYGSLLRATRRQYHRQIAEALLAQFPEAAEKQPEIVAHHYSSADMHIEAARYWRKAGELAQAHSANVEALAHFTRALTDIAASPKSPRRFREEVLLHVALGATLTAAKGYAAPEVEKTYAQARTLCLELDDPSYLFPALRGLHSFYLVRGPLRLAREMGEQLYRMSEKGEDRLQRVEAHRRLGWCLFCLGNLEAGRSHLQLATEEYDRAQSTQHIVAYGSDPAVVGNVNLAWVEWFAGRANTARHYNERAIRLGRDIKHGLSLAYALGMSAALYQCLGDAQTAATLAQETISLAEERGFPYWTAWSSCLLGWALAAQGDTETGMAKLRAGLDAYRETGAELFRPHILGLMAELGLRTGRHRDAISYCDEALASGARTDVHFVDGSILRLKGDLLLACGEASAAQSCLEQAVAVAREQSAGMLELRGAVRLAELHRAQGRRDAARDCLLVTLSRAEKYEESPDLAAAQALLSRLG